MRIRRVGARCGRVAALVVLGLGTLELAGCQMASNQDRLEAMPRREMAPPGLRENQPAAARPDQSQSGAVGWEVSPAESGTWLASASDAAAVAQERRVVVYTAEYEIVVNDASAAIKTVEKLVADAGGYLQGIQGDSITIRVPAARYAEVIEQVERLGRVSNRKQTAEDVTEEYVDLEARLSSARKVRERLETLLKQAEDVQATLAVEKELARVGQEIERLEAKLALLKNRVAYSTITVKFVRVARQTQIVPECEQLPFTWLRQLDPNRLWRGY